MSRTKEYIDNLMDQGIDPFATEDPQYDLEYQKFLEDSYRQSLEEMNRYFAEHPDEEVTHF